MSYFDDASLVMIPSGYKTSKVYSVKPTDGSADLTFSRSNDTATRVNSAGLIEKVRTNVALYSEDQTNWTDQNQTSVTANAAANPLNGAVTADKVIPSATTDDHYRGLSMGSMIGEISSSIYVKADGYSIIDYGVYNSTALNYPVRAVFDLSTQAITYINGSIASITSVGSGWYRISVTASVASTGTMQIYHRVRPSGTSGTYAGNGTSGMLLWGCQLESGVTTPYIGPTTTAAVSVGPVANVPRLDYLNSTCPRLLLEPQRTNLVTYSEQLNTGSGGTTPVTANTAVSPDGYTNADTIGTGYWTKSTSQSAGTYTLSVFAKYQSAASIGLYIYDGAYYQGSFNLQTGVATPASGSPTVSMVSYGNGWYRCILTATTASTISEVGFGSGNFYGYGLQLEAGAYATSYIPTLGAAVTRGADDCVKSSATSIIGQTEGVVYFEWEYQNTGSSGGNIPISLDGAGGDEIYFWVQTNGTYRFDVGDSGSGVVGITGSMGSFGTKKIALAYKNNDFALYINGVLAGTDTSGTVPTCNRLYVGRYYANSSYNISSGIKQVLLFPTRLSNADLAALTA